MKTLVLNIIPPFLISTLAAFPWTPARAEDWTQWRGPDRAANSALLPESFEPPPILLWEQPLEGDGISGIVATENRVIVADRDASDPQDVFRCFEATSGEELWSFSYSAPGRLDRDYGSAPRAAPLILGHRLYTLGGFGHLHCLELETGKVVWNKNLPVRFSARIPQWGYSGSPLFVPADPKNPGSQDKLIVQPGGLVALDPESGEILWRSPDANHDAAYASPIFATFSGKPQILAYDRDSLGGWDVETGEKRWELRPPKRGDFNVPTPVVIGNRILLSSENNGTRLYDFDENGAIRPDPVAINNDLSPDSSTAVFLDGNLYGVHRSLFRLDPGDSLKTVGSLEEDAFSDYASLIGGKTRTGKKRLLVAGMNGEVLLIDVDDATPKLAGRIGAPSDTETLLAHPAVVGRKLYVRSVSGLRCYLTD